MTTVWILEQVSVDSLSVRSGVFYNPMQSTESANSGWILGVRSWGRCRYGIDYETSTLWFEAPLSGDRWELSPSVIFGTGEDKVLDKHREAARRVMIRVLEMLEQPVKPVPAPRKPYDEGEVGTWSGSDS